MALAAFGTVEAARSTPDQTPPTVTIATPTDGASFAQDSIVASSFSCQDEDGGSGISTCLGPQYIDTSETGPQVFSVTATDAAGNATTQEVSYTVVADTTPPTAAISAPEDGDVFAQNQPVTVTYGCNDEAGGSGLASCSGPAVSGGHLDTSAVGGQQAFTVTAQDRAGNESTATIHYTVLADSTAPTIALSSQPAGSTFAQNQPVTVNYSCSDVNGDAVASGVASCSGPAASGGQLDTTTLGPHTFTVTAEDNNGNQRTADLTYTVVADATPPTIQFSTSPDGTATEDTFAQHQAVTVTYSCADESSGSGIASCSAPVPSGSALDTSTLGLEQSFTVTAADHSGNEQTFTFTYGVIADTTAPVITLASSPTGTTFAQNRPVTVTYSCADEVNGSGVASNSCTAPVASGGLLDTTTLGAHHFEVVAADNSGNQSTSDIDYTVVADTTLPTVTLTSPVDGASFDQGQGVNASFACADEAGGSGIASCAATGGILTGHALDTSTVGPHTFTVTATDHNGNVATATASYTVIGGSGAVAFVTGCDANTLSRNDDGSTGRINLPFAINFFGRAFNSLFVNNNGNVTFDQGLGTFTPLGLVNNAEPIIAPFWADVDTRNQLSGQVHYGNVTFNGQPAFCVLWTDVGYGKGVGYYGSHADKLNSFQLLLVDRGDVGTAQIAPSGSDTPVAADDFDMIFNYDTMRWETGDASSGRNGLGGSPARIGYSNGNSLDPNGSFELPGSAVSGAFLNSNPSGLIFGSRGSNQRGRYIFPVRSGQAPSGHAVSGQVTGPDGSALAAAIVALCRPIGCTSALTNSDGRYVVSGLPAGDYTLRAIPPADSGLLPAESPLTLGTADISDANVKLGLALSSRRLTIMGCANGTATYTITRGGTQIATGSLLESPAGTYSVNVDDVSPVHGQVHVTTSLVCPNATTQTQSVDVFADPSGTVQNAANAFVNGATVTLLRRNEDTGAFEAVPSGSRYLSPASPDNPETTGADGAFGWDVAPGEYKIQAFQAACGSATTDSFTVTSSQSPSDIVVHLPCGSAPSGSSDQGTSSSASSTPPPLFTAAAAGPPPSVPPPVKNESVGVAPVAGTVLLNGQPFTAGQLVPFGSTFDTTNGILQLSSIGPNGEVQTVILFGAVFTVQQGADGATVFVLQGGNFAGLCGSPARHLSAADAKPPKAKPKPATKKKIIANKTVVRSLWGQGKGSFRTQGRYASATVRGTLWLTADRCDGTLTEVKSGLVDVLDIVRNQHFSVAAGHSYLVRPR
jgi:hypothetical protein